MPSFPRRSSTTFCRAQACFPYPRTGDRTVKIRTPDPSPLQQQFALTRKELSEALIEREEEVDLVLTALVAQEHLLLVGPPGCAKSLLLDGLMTWMSGSRFTVLLNRFSCPEEILG